MKKETLKSKVAKIHNEIMGTMSDYEIANMTEAEMEAIAERVADSVLGVPFDAEAEATRQIQQEQRDERAWHREHGTPYTVNGVRFNEAR